ncbi:MAG: Asp-tRNA(Asn)/Glu-tRNA(Gln) amidotransferase subunit GatA [Acidobacteria bacterium]|nr:Asp-tRNA(Asn)/Glu-tRNA(Gln) amidotransferase subunit GatA [Acidobacteriota bacterium]
MKLHELTLCQAREKLRRKEISAVELCRAILARLEEVEPRVQAFLSVDPDRALRRAAEIDSEEVAWKDGRPLAGIPLAIKDVICTRGWRTTCGSKILYNFVPPYDATATRKLLEAGAVLVGKTNMDEFAMGSSTENSAYQITRNPWDLDRVPGGSSGGSGAAVAAHQALGALGTDTGGSIRQPAAFCGVVGLKPTYGRVSRYGLVAFASSLDQIGPIGKDVRDTALLLEAIAGFDPQDSTSVNRPVPRYSQWLEGDVRGMKVGFAREFFVEGLDPEVRAAVERALRLLEGMGCEVLELSLPHTPYAIAAYYIVAPAEASSNLARYDGVKYGYRAPEGATLSDMYSLTRSQGFGPEVKRRIMIGTYALSAGYYDAYYLKALKVRTLIKQDYLDAFQRVDFIASPTAPTPPFKIGEKTEDPLAMYLCDVYTVPINLAGLPSISVPCAFTPEGLPIGLQLTGRYFEEERLLRIAYAFEQAANLQRPPLKV